MSESGCRCRCREENCTAPRPVEPCCFCCECQPQVFTSVLLAFLACVLVAGGVYLALHKWDHAWLLVSAIGVLLMGIGTALHCCSTHQKNNQHSCKGGCSTRSVTDLVGTGGTTEQLLPLSNARSVSQLSLNMVPGYFPPMVYPGVPATSIPYGLEQHSAVVQNISRVVQNQQLLQQTESGKNFIVLSIPGENNSTSVHNLVAAVYQLDGSSSTDNTNREASPTDTASQTAEAPPVPRVDTDNSNPSSASAVQASSPCPPLLKHAEVQTCDLWSVSPTVSTVVPTSAATSHIVIPNTRSAIETSNGLENDSREVAAAEIQRTANSVPIVPSVVNLDSNCLSQESTPLVEVPVSDVICDNVEAQTDNIPSHTAPCNSNLNINEIIPCVASDLVASTSTDNVPSEHSSSNNYHSSSEVSGISPSNDENSSTEASEGLLENVRSLSDSSTAPPNQDLLVLDQEPLPSSSQSIDTSTVADFTPLDGTANEDDLSDAVSDDSDLLDRSSPPPSYEDVVVSSEEGTSEAQVAVGAFGLAYGTI